MSGPEKPVGGKVATECVKEWRTFFTPAILKKASSLLTMRQYEDFGWNKREAHAIFGQGASVGRAVIRDAPTNCSENWNPQSFSCSCLSKAYQSPEAKEKLPVCVHEAALLLLWERQRGPWKFSETREEVLARQERERREQELELERERREDLRKREGHIKREASALFAADRSSTYFQIHRSVEGYATNEYAVHRAAELLRDGVIEMDPPQLGYGDDGRQELSVSARVSDALERRSVALKLSTDELLNHHCDCHGFYLGDDRETPLCEHELAVLDRLREYVERENPGDATDRAAEQFFLELEASPEPDASGPAAPERVRNARAELIPRVTLDNGEVQLSFKIGEGRKFVILKNLRELLSAVDRETLFTTSRVFQLDFAEVDFTDDSRRWLTFIRRRVSEIDLVNERLHARSYGSWNATAPLHALYQDVLKGATLDRFYDVADGTACEYQDRKTRFSGMIRVGHADLKIRVVAERIADADGNFLGVAVTGAMPMILKGADERYFLNQNALSRLTAEERQALEPFRAVTDASGNVRFLVGRRKLAEFYYRVVPRFLESPYVDFIDRCGQEAESVLPPKPDFLFRLDLENGDCFLQAFVTYGDAEPLRLPRLPEEIGQSYSDFAQESRVTKAILRYFPRYEESSRTYHADASEENLYRILTEGVDELSRYGETLGSDAFRRCSPRPAPQFRVGVSVESGLLDISVLSEGIPHEELLDVLESYRRKKTFHRLKSGAFLTLEEDKQFASLDSVMQELNLSAEEVLSGRARLPLFRALYLDSTLAKHRELASDRQPPYRAFLRRFDAIRDADYPIPAAQADILRPYQAYGYKWLRTLAAAGFGGILADEMGLGKTLQSIAFLQGLKESGDAGPHLIVCPASLVYNWQEEFEKFAPSLHTWPIAGPAAVRREYLIAAAQAQSDNAAQSADVAQSADAPQAADVAQSGDVAPSDAPAHIDAYITSYDLLRQDIEWYEKLQFSAVILDEAQYIKNQKAGVTKAVKILRSRRRFALTGTPIENRLAELWSIFDFLMPGFLYSYPEFLRKFETPVTKSRDPDAVERLTRMTAPFILRRLKSDVLKDLPPKLEEVRYTRFEGEQRKLYDGQVIRMKRLIADAAPAGEDRMRIFAELMRIRQICCDPALIFENYSGGSAKRAACIELIQNAVAGGHRMLVFSQFTSMLALLEADLQKIGIPYYKIVGSTPKEQRLQLVNAFNGDDTPVFLISLKAGGAGLNLTGADTVIHYDPWWNVAAQNQATDRAHRIGQKSQVVVYRLIVKGSVEEKILAMQDAKKDLADAILSGEGESLFTLTNEELLDLLS